MQKKMTVVAVSLALVATGALAGGMSMGSSSSGPYQYGGPRSGMGQGYPGVPGTVAPSDQSSEPDDGAAGPGSGFGTGFGPGFPGYGAGPGVGRGGPGYGMGMRPMYGPMGPAVAPATGQDQSAGTEQPADQGFGFGSGMPPQYRGGPGMPGFDQGMMRGYGAPEGQPGAEQPGPSQGFGYGGPMPGNGYGPGAGGFGYPMGGSGPSGQTAEPSQPDAETSDSEPGAGSNIPPWYAGSGDTQGGGQPETGAPYGYGPGMPPGPGFGPQAPPWYRGAAQAPSGSQTDSGASAGVPYGYGPGMPEGRFGPMAPPWYGAGRPGAEQGGSGYGFGSGAPPQHGPYGVQMSRTAEGYEYFVPLHGVSAEEVSVQVQGHRLLVSRDESVSKNTETPGPGSYSRSYSYSFGRFHRSFSLPSDADPAGMTYKTTAEGIRIFLPRLKQTQ